MADIIKTQDSIDVSVYRVTGTAKTISVDRVDSELYDSDIIDAAKLICNCGVIADTPTGTDADLKSVCITETETTVYDIEAALAEDED